MPEWENELRRSFGNRSIADVKRYKNNVVALHKSIENFTGQTYKPPKKTLEKKIADVLKLAAVGSEWDSRTMQLHLFFFHQTDFNRSYISRLLKKLADKGLLDKVAKGRYIKAG